MTLKTLEQRFNETAKDIYNRFQPDPDQLVSIKPDTNGVFGSRSRVKDDTRALPTTSFVRDSRRISNFLKSQQGLLYIGKQAVLQTGNTFEQTRKYNPLSNIRIPNTLRIKRYFGGDDALRGVLQPSTIATFSGKEKTPASTKNSVLNNNDIFYRPEFRVFSAGDNIYSPFLSTQPIFEQRSRLKGSAFTAAKFPVTTKNVNGNRSVEETLDLNNRAFNYGLKFRLVANGSPTAIPSEQIRNNIRLKKKFDNLGSKFTNGKTFTDFYFAGNDRGYGAVLNKDSGLFEEEGARAVSSDDPPVNRMVLDRTIPYDRLNTLNPYKTFNLEQTNRIDYTKLVPTTGEEESTTPDIINFAFQANGQDQPIIKFRAFISQFKQSTKPEYQEQKYLGRTERFVAYSGAKRTASLVFNIVAFSQNELTAVWSKINYLTGLAFPLGVSSGGFMIPPLFKISIGGIYDAQPCYVETLDFDFINEDITFDIDNEVSQFVNVNMSITLLEKRSRFYNSPFYQITQDLVGPESQSPTRPERLQTITNQSQQV